MPINLGVKIKLLKNRRKRVIIVNEIIKLISTLDRHFFRNEKDNFVSYIIIKKNKLYFVDYYTKKDIYLHKPKYHHWHNFTSGGTLKGLITDFKEFIMYGKPSNGSNGYGGLYCTHWGYSADSMELIRKKATELGYLLQGVKTC